jgi:phosphatidate cytidylyltransferase
MTGPAKDPSRWSDLTIRVTSAVVLIVVGFGAAWIGHDVFHVLVALVCGAMVWELVRMLSPDTRPIAFQIGALSGSAVLMASYLPLIFVLPVLGAPALVGMSQIKHHRAVFGLFCLLTLLAGISMLLLRDNFGFQGLLWLLLVVVVTDIAGYFAGRIFGGPKFWPRYSPKKTWSGTVAGWLGAAFVGAVFAIYTDTGFSLVVVSVLLSFASQLGDIGESAIKRLVDVKDSSSIIPGHGGVLDRFDGMLGACILLLLIGLTVGYPPGLG